MLGFKRLPVSLVIILAWAIQNCTFGISLLWYTFAIPLVVSLVYAIGSYDHDYWTNRGVFSPPADLFVGHIKSVMQFKEQGGLFFKRIYDTYKDVKFLGVHQFFQRTLVVRDPELVRRMCVGDFQHFVDRGFFFRADVDPLAGSVLYLRGAEWKRMRAKISPIFSPNKLRGMFPLIDDTAKEFIIRLKKRCSKNYNEISDANHNYIAQDVEVCDVTEDFNKNMKDVKTGSTIEDKSTTNDWKPSTVEKEVDFNSINGKTDNAIVADCEKLVGGFTADAIVPCAFGLKSSVMDNEKDPFAVALHAFYEMSLSNLFVKTMHQFWPSFVLFFGFRIIPKKTHDFFYNIVTNVLRARDTGVQEKRGDFIDMMMALRNDDINENSISEDDDIEITEMVIAANAFIIFLGGFETTSSTLAFLLLELAAHPSVQERARREVLEAIARHGGVTYEALRELAYIETVIQETLRLYPPFPTIQRMCTKDYTIPETSVMVEKGTIVLFPTLGIHRDEQYFERASAFDPDRWAEGRPPPPPGVYSPFGDGPRYCIGKRFAMIQMKCFLAKMLSVARVSPAPGREPRTAPFAADPRSPLTLHPLDSRLTISLL